jgi:hypothetical protein
VTLYPTSSPSWKIGMQSATSGWCEAPWNDELCMITSPSCQAWPRSAKIWLIPRT